MSSFFRFNRKTGRMSFYKCFSSVTKEFLAIPEIFCKTWLSSVVDNNIAVIRCVNDMTWLAGKSCC
ncbi:hypothetical protein Hanom_Chr01g00054911 [Helianthus anomalus]